MVENRDTRSYNQEDVQRILQFAIARQAKDQDKEFSYQQLLEIGAELEISPDCLQQAEQDWLVSQGELQQRQAFDTYRRGKFNKRLGNYVIANSFLVTLNLVQGGFSWSLYVLLLWGLAVSLDGWNTFQTKGQDYEEAFAKWNRKHQLKQTFSNLINRFLKSGSG